MSCLFRIGGLVASRQIVNRFHVMTTMILNLLSVQHESHVFILKLIVTSLLYVLLLANELDIHQGIQST
jgi:hypothetical protein